MIEWVLINTYEDRRTDCETFAGDHSPTASDAMMKSVAASGISDER